MDKPKATPKDFFLWAGAMVALYVGVFSFVGLLFDYINYAFPDTALQYYSYDPYQGSVSYEMASLMVLAPVLLILMRVIRRGMQADPSRREIWVRRWALFLVLFVAGSTIVVDLIVLIHTFLQGGDLTTRFLLKVVVVLLVAAAGFMHFIADLWGYWERFPKRARYVSWGVGVLVVATIASGFLVIGSPQQARALRIDAQRITDLQSLQSQILFVYQQKGTLPKTIAELNDPLSYYSVPVDPETKQPYRFVVKAPLTFELCANFATAGVSNRYNVVSQPTPAGVGKGVADNWQHGAGDTCFERTIDPQLYPVLPKGR